MHHSADLLTTLLHLGLWSLVTTQTCRRQRMRATCMPSTWETVGMPAWHSLNCNRTRCSGAGLPSKILDTDSRAREEGTLARALSPVNVEHTGTTYRMQGAPHLPRASRRLARDGTSSSSWAMSWLRSSRAISTLSGGGPIFSRPCPAGSHQPLGRRSCTAYRSFAAYAKQLNSINDALRLPHRWCDRRTHRQCDYLRPVAPAGAV